jgi:hypothetical protein
VDPGVCAARREYRLRGPAERRERAWRRRVLAYLKNPIGALDLVARTPPTAILEELGYATRIAELVSLGIVATRGVATGAFAMHGRRARVSLAISPVGNTRAKSPKLTISLRRLKAVSAAQPPRPSAGVGQERNGC